MKRSKSIRLVLLGSVGALSLAACEEPPQTLGGNEFFRDEAQCAAKENPDACRQALADARAAHQRTAPAFASREACEARFGEENCTPAAAPPTPQQVAEGGGAAAAPTVGAGGGWFLPLMMGYMMGRTFNGFQGQPVYRDTRNTAYSAGRPVGQFNDRLTPPPRAASGQVARGGFGSSAARGPAAGGGFGGGS